MSDFHQTGFLTPYPHIIEIAKLTTWNLIIMGMSFFLLLVFASKTGFLVCMLPTFHIAAMLNEPVPSK